jgi:hypothetical protein
MNIPSRAMMQRTHILLLLVIGILGLTAASLRLWLSWQTHAWLEVAGYSLSLVAAIAALVVAIGGMRGRLRLAAPRGNVERLPNDR